VGFGACLCSCTCVGCPPLVSEAIHALVQTRELAIQSSNRKVKRAVGILILIDPDELVLGFCAAGRAEIFHYLGVN